MNFGNFQVQKWTLQTVRAEKIDKRNEAICLVFIFPSWVMVLKFSKKVHFLQFFVDLNIKPKSIKAIYIYAFESSHYTFLENDMLYRDLSLHSWDISD